MIRFKVNPLWCFAMSGGPGSPESEGEAGGGRSGGGRADGDSGGTMADAATASGLGGAGYGGPPGYGGTPSTAGYYGSGDSGWTAYDNIMRAAAGIVPDVPTTPTSGFSDPEVQQAAADLGSYFDNLIGLNAVLGTAVDTVPSGTGSISPALGPTIAAAQELSRPEQGPTGQMPRRSFSQFLDETLYGPQILADPLMEDLLGSLDAVTEYNVMNVVDNWSPGQQLTEQQVQDFMAAATQEMARRRGFMNTVFGPDLSISERFGRPIDEQVVDKGLQLAFSSVPAPFNLAISGPLGLTMGRMGSNALRVAEENMSYLNPQLEALGVAPEAIESGWQSYWEVPGTSERMGGSDDRERENFMNAPSQRIVTEDGYPVTIQNVRGVMLPQEEPGSGTGLGGPLTPDTGYSLYDVLKLEEALKDEDEGDFTDLLLAEIGGIEDGSTSSDLGPAGRLF